SWLVLHDAEYRLAHAGEMSQKQAEYWEKRINACHRRYLSAVKMLATVRRLAVPVIVGQVNVAGKQVNVLNPAGLAGQLTTPAADRQPATSSPNSAIDRSAA